MSRFAIQLYFDEITNQRIKALWSVLNDHGLIKILCPARGYVPHISLAVAAELEPDEIVPVVRSFAAQTKSLPVVLSHLGVFNNADSTLWLGPNFSDDLRSVHRALWNSLQLTKVAWWPYYTPENWVPHCALVANRPFEIIFQAFQLCSEFKLPLSGKLESVTLVDFREGTEFCVEPLQG
jgi:2'-5' RNA ligase